MMAALLFAALLPAAAPAVAAVPVVPAAELLASLEGEDVLVSALGKGDPAPVLLGRLRALARERVEADKKWRERVVRRVWIGHLVVEHAISEESVADRLAELDAQDEGAVGAEQRRFKTEAVLWELYERLRGKGFAAALRAEARRRPAAPAASASLAAPAEPSSGLQLTWTDVEALIRYDTAAHPLFWELRPDDYIPR
jgi:hypothetical protein